jgi:hypothetical protein
MEVLKLLTPALGLFIISSFKYRSTKQIASYSSILLAAGILSNEYYQWNRVSGRLYIAMRSDF